MFYGITVVNGVMLRRSWFDQVGGFDPQPQLNMCEDMDLWYRLAVAQCPMAWVREVVCKYRIHASNASRHVAQHYAAHFAALDKFFAGHDVPPHISKRKNEYYASLSLTRAGQLYTVGQYDDAQASVRAAIQLDPTLGQFSSPSGQRVILAMVYWQASPWVIEPAGFLDRVFSHWPAEHALTARQQQQVRTLSNKANFYEATAIGNPGIVPTLWRQIAREEPNWLLNRGGWAILLKSFKRQHSK